MLDPPMTAPEPENASTPEPSAPERICPNCGESFPVRVKGPGKHQRFCATPCQAQWNNREKVQGSVILTKAKIWRKNRGSGEIGKAAFQRFVEALDLLIAEDEAAGRPKLTANGPVHPFLKSVVEDRYIDRQRR